MRLRFADEAADGSGLPVMPQFVVPGPREAGTRAVEAFGTAHPEVTAVAALDDDIALHVLTALHDLGLAAPDDVAVIHFDDIECSALATPALTAVHIDAEALGRFARRHVRGPRRRNDLIPARGRVVVRGSV